MGGDAGGTVTLDDGAASEKTEMDELGVATQVGLVGPRDLKGQTSQSFQRRKRPAAVTRRNVCIAHEAVARQPFLFFETSDFTL